MREHIKNLKQLEQDYANANEEKGADDLMKHGNRLLDEDDRRLREILTTVNETKQMGVAVAETLDQQTSQLKHIDADVYEIADEQKRAKAILWRMLRRVASNKYMWGMIMLIMLGIVFIIVWKVRNE